MSDEMRRRVAARVALRDNEKDSAFIALLQSDGGKSYVWDLLAFCGTTRTSFDKDAGSMAFNEGMRNVGLKLLADIMRLCPDEYINMARHAQEDKNFIAEATGAEENE